MTAPSDTLTHLQASVMRWVAPLAGTLAVSALTWTLALSSRVLTVESTLHNEVTAQREWNTAHLELHRERTIETGKSTTELMSRVASLESALRQVDQLSYRQTLNEGAVKDTNKRFDDWSNKINDVLQTMSRDLATLSSDVRVISATIQRERGGTLSEQTRRPISSQNN